MVQKEMIEKIKQLQSELDKNIFGYKGIKRRVIYALLADGHILLEGLPGLAKTLLISTLQSATGNSTWRRLQMTPDLKPSDIVGVMVWNPKTLEFDFKPGPVLGVNLFLVDEINRATPKAQSALLEAMQERKTSVDGKSYSMQELFLVLATMNPIEQEGTYPLPEAQQDRFCFKLTVGYGTRQDELSILQNQHVHGRDAQKNINQVLTVEEILEMRDTIARTVRVEKTAQEYIVDLVRCTRPDDPLFQKLVGADLANQIKVGASPRAQIWLYRAAKVRAFLYERDFVLPEDVKALAHDVLRHRIILKDEVIFEGVTTDSVIDKVLRAVPIVEPKTK